MIDKNSQFMAILTNVGAAKLANANALGLPWKITALAVGDANGTDPVPSATQTKLVNELRRAPLNQLVPDPKNAAVIVAEQVIPENVGGFWIREIGLYDQDGDLVAVANTAPTFKPLLAQGSGRTQIIRMNLIVSSVANIELKIDPSVVLATREFVELAIDKALPGDKKAGTYFKVKIDKRGIVIAGDNPTSLEGFGIEDGVTKNALSEAISGVVAKTGATMSGSLSLGNDTEDSPRLSFIAPSSEAFFNLYNKNVRIEARSDGVVSTPLVLNLPTKSAYVFGSVIWCAANFNPDLKADKATTLTAAQVNAELAKKWDLTAYPPDQYLRKGQFIPVGSNPSFGSGVVGSMASITGTLGSLQVNGEVPGAPAVIALHRPGAFGTYFGLDTDNQLKLGGWSLGGTSYVIYHAGNFNPASKLNAQNCANAGFTDVTATTPFMTHSNGTTVALQVRKPNDTALLAPTGWNKNADTGEINQWFEYTHGDFGGSAIVNVTWPFQFPNQFINASISLKFPNSATACGVTVSYSAGTITGCTLRLEEWAGFAQTGMVLVIKAKGS